MSDVPIHVKLWVYAIQGVLYELMFTALWNLSVSPDPRLMGESSIWSVWVYGLGGLCNEYFVYNKIAHKHVAFRMVVNLLYTYAWEYACGVALAAGGACPWDYSARRWNLHGLITLEYAPAWLLAGLLHERLIRLLQSVCWCDKLAHHKIA